jgi:DNA modification methylase
METAHRIFADDSRNMDALDDGEVDLVVTSPPYPMIEMWDDVFADLDPAVADCLDREDGREAFALMHEALDSTWAEVARVLTDGGIACVNVGDATRSVDGSFRVFHNHARVIDAFDRLGFEPLPDILWRKPVNSAAKFMGSGMLPPNAYATLEHEYVLVFRNGTDSRSFEPGADRRYGAAYFWEERNEWFSDVWTEITGTLQELPDDDLRERSAAFPLEIPYRLVNMYSVYGDTVLDPFWGTGTTSLAAMIAGRHSVGYEREDEFRDVFADRIGEIEHLSRAVVRERLARHAAFVERRRDDGAEPDYTASNYEFPVVTRQEREIQFYTVTDLEPTPGGYTAVHTAVDEASELE